MMSGPATSLHRCSMISTDPVHYKLICKHKLTIQHLRHWVLELKEIWAGASGMALCCMRWALGMRRQYLRSKSRYGCVMKDSAMPPMKGRSSRTGDRLTRRMADICTVRTRTAMTGVMLTDGSTFSLPAAPCRQASIREAMFKEIYCFYMRIRASRVVAC